ncbi:MAG: S53 family peptidase [Candidatus Limnocylindrales bacterium]
MPRAVVVDLPGGGFSVLSHHRVALGRAASLVASLALIGAAVGTTAAAPPSGRATLAGSVPTWASAANFKGSTTPTDSVGFRVYLGWSDPVGAAAFAAAVSNPRSSSYGHYLTPAQFRQRFSPSQASVGAVTSWLRSQGFTIDYTPTNNLYVAAEGTVAQAAAAFSVSFGEYTVGALTLRSPESALAIPASLAGTVEAIAGLDESAVLVHPDQAPTAPPPAAFVNGTPCSTYWDQFDTNNTLTNDTPPILLPNIYGTPTPWAPCGYTPQQVRGAYGVPVAARGAGVTVAIVDAYASPTIVNDVNQWSTNRGIATLKPGQFSQVVAPGSLNRPENRRQDPQGWSSEQTLDIEAVHGIAPDAKIVYVGAPNNYQDLDAALNHVVDRHLADMVTNSYGFGGEALPVGFIKPFNDIFIQAAAEGIGVYFSSGDSADETGGNPLNAAAATPDWPASSPWVTAVGGTSIGIGATNNYVLETGWESGTSSYVSKTNSWSPPPPGAFLYGSGGGTSRLFAQPSYQVGVVPTLMATANGARAQAMRVVPDVSAIADPNTGYLIGQTQTFPDGTVKYSEYRIGGTSLASPVFAGLMADLQAAKGGPALGFANPMLYLLSTSTPSAFHDITHLANAGVVRVNLNNSVDATAGYSYRFRSFDFTTGLTIHTVSGYDNVTGIGTINGSVFFGP